MAGGSVSANDKIVSHIPAFDGNGPMSMFDYVK